MPETGPGSGDGEKPEFSSESVIEPDAYLHGSAVAIGEHALFITGAAGSGKTTLAMEMIAHGADLVADDRVGIAPDDNGRLWLSASPNIAGLVEVRGFGLIRLATRPRAVLKLIADLDHSETERLPSRRKRILSSIACPVILCKGRSGLAAALTCLLRAEDWPGPEFFAQE